MFLPAGSHGALLPGLGHQVMKTDVLGADIGGPTTCLGQLLLRFWSWEQPPGGALHFHRHLPAPAAPINLDKVKDAPSQHFFVFPLPLSSYLPKLRVSCFNFPFFSLLCIGPDFSLSSWGTPTGSSEELSQEVAQASWQVTDWNCDVSENGRPHYANEFHWNQCSRKVG